MGETSTGFDESAITFRADGSIMPQTGSLVDTESDEQQRAERLRRRQKLLESGIDQRAADPECRQQAIVRVEKQMEKHDTTSRAPSTIDYYKRYATENPQGSEGLMAVIRKYPLVDLGSGPWGVFRRPRLPKPLIMVDKYNNPTGNFFQTRSNLREEDFDPRPAPEFFDTTEVDPNIYYSRSDILDFLTHLPDKSCNITMNNIDEEVLNDQEYLALLASHIERVLPDDGILITASTTVIGQHVIDRGFIDATDELLLKDDGSPAYHNNFFVRAYRKPVDLIDMRSKH